MIALRHVPLSLLSSAVFASAVDAQSCAFTSSRLTKANLQHHSSITNDQTRRLTVRWQRGDCELRVDARGDFRVRPDLAGVTSIEDGVYVDIEERDGDRDRSVRIPQGRDGVQYRWRVDGENGFDVNRE